MKTGEEEEEQVFGERAKLFRYTGGEWKERGLGVMKILKNPLTGMRVQLCVCVYICVRACVRNSVRNSVRA